MTLVTYGLKCRQGRPKHYKMTPMQIRFKGDEDNSRRQWSQLSCNPFKCVIDSQVIVHFNRLTSHALEGKRYSLPQKRT